MSPDPRSAGMLCMPVCFTNYECKYASWPYINNDDRSGSPLFKSLDPYLNSIDTDENEMTKLAQILLQRAVFLKKCTVLWKCLRSKTETNKSVEDIKDKILQHK